MADIPPKISLMQSKRVIYNILVLSQNLKWPRKFLLADEKLFVKWDNLAAACAPSARTRWPLDSLIFIFESSNRVRWKGLDLSFHFQPTFQSSDVWELSYGPKRKKVCLKITYFLVKTIFRRFKWPRSPTFGLKSLLHNVEIFKIIKYAEIRGKIFRVKHLTLRVFHFHQIWKIKV